ncbi:MAG: hypothetical protein IT230_12875 [Flavobacteriales bacterium]|nr:hypothetical protein [Flavobacteriales bacterium]
MKAKEAHRNALTKFLWYAVGIMNYTNKPGPITYTITETEEGYTFHMDWETTKVKAQGIKDTIDLMKVQDRPATGKTLWRHALVGHMEALLGYCSELEYAFTPHEGHDLASAHLDAMVRFSSLVDAPHIPRLYVDGPQRQVSIFDLFEYQRLERNQLHMGFLVGDDQELAVRISVPGKHAELTLGNRTRANHHLVRFLRSIRNIIHCVEEKKPLVNVATMRTSRYYVDYDESFVDDDDEDDDAWSQKAEVLHTRYAHFREDGTHCSMDLRNLHGWGSTFNILVREGADLVLEDDWFYRSSGSFIEHRGWKEQPTRAQLEATVRLAFTADEYDLRAAVSGAMHQFLHDLGPGRYKEIYNAEPPYELFERI